MPSSPYILGKTVDEFKNTPTTYLFALRRTEDGDLYLLKSKLTQSGDSVQLFGDEMPVEFVDYDFPGDDYFEGRGEDKELVFSTDDVKYEQWKWVDGLTSYYIDTDGNFVLSIGTEVNLPIVEDIEVPTGHTQSFTIPGQIYNLNLYEKLVELGWNGVSEVTATITGDILSNSPIKPAIVVDRPFVNGLTIINNGNIKGCNGNIQYDPTVNRNFGVAISIDYAIDSFVNNGSIEAGAFNGNYANAFRGYGNIEAYTGEGTWVGYDD